MSKKNYVDLSKDTDNIDDLPEDEAEGHPEPEQPAWAPPVRRVRQKTGDYAIPEERSREEEDDMMNPFVALEAAASQETEPSPEERDSEPAGASASSFPEQARKREPEEPAEPPPGKRSRIELLEIYNLQMQSLIKQRARKEARVKDFRGPDAVRLQRASTKEITNNLLTGAYELLSAKDSKKVIETKSDKIMNSRYVFTKKPLENSEVDQAKAEDILLEDDGSGPHKAKCRHVLQGFSDLSALEVESTTPQVQHDSVVFVAQVLASMQWVPGFVDFIQAFHSGDKLERELYSRLPPEGIPGAHKSQVLRFLKTYYGLTDGPHTCFQYLIHRLTQDYGYRASQFDPCLFFLQDSKIKEDSKPLKGIIGLATDDMLHGGDSDHWAILEKIAKEYKLGKNQQGKGRFADKDISLQMDGSITIKQGFYAADKVVINSIQRK